MESAESLFGDVLKPFSTASVRSGCEQSQQSSPLFDHLIGALLKKPRHVEAERRGGLEVDHQLELDRGLDRKLTRLRILEDAIGIGRRAPKIIDQVTSVGQQAAEFSEDTGRIDGRKTVARRQQGDLRAMSDHEGIH